MANIQMANRTVFTELLKDPAELAVCVKGFQDAIELSFVTNSIRMDTRHEAKRRFNICCKLFERLKLDYQFSTAKALDYLPTYLKCELDGVPYDPATVRDVWAPSLIEAQHDVPQTPKIPIIGKG